MPIYKRDEIIAWYNDETDSILHSDCYDGEEGYLPLTEIREDEVAFCDECGKEIVE